MRRESKALLKQFPLDAGEELIAEIAGKDENGNREGIILTPTRIGAWHSGPAFVCPLYTVSDWAFEGGIVRVQWDNGVVHVVDTGSADDARGFFLALRDARQGVMRPECADGIAAGVRSLVGGDLGGAIAAFEAAAEADPFHPGAALLLFHLQRWAGNRQAAVSALTRVIEPAMNMEASTVCLWPNAPFAAIDLYIAAARLGVDGPVDDLSLGQTIFAALRAARLGERTEAAQLVDVAFSKCGQDMGVFFYTLSVAAAVLPSESGPKLRTATLSAAATPAGQEVAGLFELIAKMLDRASDPLASADAALALCEATGSPLDAAALRVHERWASVLSDEGLPDLDPADLDELGSDVAASERVRGWLAARYDPGRDAEQVWAALRLGRLDEAQAFLLESPGAWYRTIVDAFPREAHEPWLAGIAETECLLRAGRQNEASNLLDVVYRERVATFGDGRELYLKHATNLYGLYKALTGNCGADARMYARLLGTEPGFGWVGAVADLIPLETRPKVAVNDAAEMREFEGWIAKVRQSLGLDRSARFVDALAALERARADRSVRVVIGGETSAGKSSFINALIGEPVLFVTEEEATAVPTLVKRGGTWAAEVARRGLPNERLDIGALPTESDRHRLQGWVRRYTAVGSRDSESATALTLQVPTEAIPEGVAYVDTPGLNAHSLRTERAQRAIEDAHACIFVVDAGSALKAGEMSKIRWASTEVGKTIFVLNKMDKAIGDPELDCDENAVGDLLARMRVELARTLGAEPLIYGVCSLPEASVRMKAPEALPFVRAIPDVRQKLADLLRGSRERLIIRSAAKVARVAAAEALARASAEVAGFESEVGRLSQRLPDDPDTFREHVSTLTNAVWNSTRGEYVDRMQAEMGTAGERCMNRVVAGMNGCQNREQIKSFVTNRVRGTLNEFVSDVDAARAREWATLGKTMLDEVQALFQALYADAKFAPDFETGDMLRLATPIPLAKSVSDLANAVDGLIFEAGAKEVGGAAAGALLGSFLLPGIGTMVGAWLGSAAGGSMNEDFPQQVYERIQARHSEIFDKVADALNNDINPGADGTQPILRAIGDVVDRERARFERVLRAEIARIEAQRARALVKAEGARAHVSEAARWITRLEAMLQGA